MAHCFVCDRTLIPGDVGSITLEEVAKNIQKLLADISPNHVIVISSEDKLCRKCCDLMSRISRLECELRTANLALRALIRLKYSLDFSGQPQLPQPQLPQPPLLVVPATDGSKKNILPTRKEKSIESIKEECKPKQKHKLTQTLKLSRSLQCNCWESMEINTRQENKMTQTLNSNKNLQCNCLEICESTTASSSKKISSKKNKNKSPFSSEVTEDSDVSCSVHDIVDLEMEQIEEITSNDNCDGSEQFACFLDETEVAEDKIVVPLSGDNQIFNNEVLSKRVFKCGMCHFKSKSFQIMKTHFVYFKHKKEYYCSICDYGFHKKNSFNKHKAKHLDNSSDQLCLYCKKGMHDNLHLKYHLKLVHKKAGLYVCSLCNKVFRFGKELRRHRVRIHRIMNQFSCEKCNTTFNDKTRLMKHKEYGHRESLNCLYCKKQFSSIDKLSQHEYTIHNHLKSEKYQCSFCPRSFSRKEFLPEHEQQHTEQFEFRCEICNYGFHEEGLLQAHRVHHKTKNRYRYPHKRNSLTRNWMCEICGKVIAMYHNYKMHRKLHDDPTPFQCPTCSKKFRYKGNMNIHIRRVHPTIELDHKYTQSG